LDTVSHRSGYHSNGPVAAGAGSQRNTRVHGFCCACPDAARLREALRAHADEVRANLIGVDDLVSYFIIDTNGGVASVTLCRDRVGCEESRQVARAWLDEHVPGVSGQVVVTEGPVDLHVG